jgi:hypothetical protein
MDDKSKAEFEVEGIERVSVGGTPRDARWGVFI